MLSRVVCCSDVCCVAVMCVVEGGVLQCVAVLITVCCSVWQRATVCDSFLNCVATLSTSIEMLRSSSRKCVTACYDVLQCVALCCRVLQCLLQCVTACCSVLRCVAVCGSA